MTADLTAGVSAITTATATSTKHGNACAPDGAAGRGARRRVSAALLALVAGMALAGCMTQLNDPLLGQAAATLPGSEFGPPPALVADLDRAEQRLAAIVPSLERLEREGFFAQPEEQAARTLQALAAAGTVAAAGPGAVAAWRQVALASVHLQALAADITQRLTAMEEVRRRSNYVPQVEAQRRLTDEMRAARAEALALQQRVGYENAWGRALAGMQRGRVEEVGRVDHGNGTATVRYRVHTGAGPYNTAAVERAEAALSEGQREADRLRRVLSAGGGLRFEQAKDVIGAESRAISDRLWPALREARADLERWTAAVRQAGR